MAEVNYKRVREIMWTDQQYRLRELPVFYGFPLLIKVMKGTNLDVDAKETVKKGEILRIHGDHSQRRVIAADSKGRHWSFPVHIGAKFDVPSKKDRRTSVYMSEIVELDKLPKKFSFAKKDDMQINITGENPTTAGPLIEGDFKTREVTRVRFFKANRISDDEIDPKVLFLPAYLDVDVTIATKLACEPESFWDEYMEAITSDITKKVNFDMYRGKADIQIYEFSKEIVKKSKRNSACLYEEVAPNKVVTIGSMIKQRTPSVNRNAEGKRMSRTPSTGSAESAARLSTFGPAESTESEEPQRAVKDILTDLQDKDETEMTEEEIRVAKHRRMMLAILAREEEEEREAMKQREEGGKEEEEGKGDKEDTGDDAAGDDGEDGTADRKSRGEGDGDETDEDNDDDEDDDDDGGGNVQTGENERPDSTEDSKVGESMPGELGKLSPEDVARRPRSPGDGSPVTNQIDDGDSVFADNSPRSIPKPRIPPRVPTRRTPPMKSPPAVTAPNNVSSDTTSPTGQVVRRPPPLPKPKPAVPPKSSNPPEPPFRPPVVSRAGTKVGTAQLVTRDEKTSRYTHISEYPADLTGLTIDDMCQALTLLRLEKYEDRIREHKVDGELAKELTADILKSDFGMNALDSMKLNKFIHDNWRPV
ncbi:uncharacterized protein [Diadema setosum]|uniref:uncharacterized protein n=1 Tax=Diadema setosum TaxID=31175 RepID=UPI003B3A856C